MTKEKFTYGLNACAVTYHNGQKLYEHDELVKCFEDLGVFEQEPKTDVLDKLRAEVCDIDDNIVLNPDSLYERKVYVRLIEVVAIIDKYNAESEE